MPRPMPRAFLHIGLAKTGTKTLQGALLALEQPLRERGVHHLRTGRFGPQGGHHRIAWALRDAAHPRLGDYELARTAAEVARLRARGVDIVLTSEEFSLLAYSAAALGALDAMLEGFERVVVAYVREQATYFNSFYAELVKDLQTAERADAVIGRLRAEPRYHYADWMRPFAERFERLVVRPYERSVLRGGDVAADMLALIGAEDLAVPEGELNVSPDPLQIALYRRARAVLEARGQTEATLPPEDWRAVKHAVDAHVKARGKGHGTGYGTGYGTGRAFWGLDRPLLDSIRAQFAESNAAFLDRHAGGARFRERRPERNALALGDVPPEERRALLATVLRALPGG